MNLNAVCICHKGKVRSNNEDNFYFAGGYLKEKNNGLPNMISVSKEFSETVCFGVFDGMGGEACGEKASYIAAKSFAGIVSSHQKGISTQWMADACLKMNEEVCAESRKQDYIRMGSTVAVIALEKEKAYICNLGDSKIFLLRSNDFIQLSIDHTDERILRECGIRTRKPTLTQHLGIHSTEMVIEPYCKEIGVCKGDRFLLCSDGLTDMVSNTEIKQILEDEKVLQDAIECLKTKALEKGGRDNITIILAEII